MLSLLDVLPSLAAGTDRCRWEPVGGAGSGRSRYCHHSNAAHPISPATSNQKARGGGRRRCFWRSIVSSVLRVGSGNRGSAISEAAPARSPTRPPNQDTL